MERGYWLAGKELIENQENWDKLTEFYEKFYPAFAMTSVILLPVARGASLEDSYDKRWNTVPDISLMITALYFTETMGSVLITEETKMHEFYEANEMSKSIMSLSNFKKCSG